MSIKGFPSARTRTPDYSMPIMEPSRGALARFWMEWMVGNDKHSAKPQKDHLFLPDFCTIPMVYSVVVVGELLAFILVLTPAGSAGGRWTQLALVSLFVQWVGLSSTALLCASRRWLESLGNVAAGFAGYILVLLVTGMLSEAAYWLVQQPILGIEAPAIRPLGETAYWPLQGGGPSLDHDTARHLNFLLRNLAISAIVSAVALRYLYIHHQWKARLESQTEARIQALQSRIRPHFLFNSMNTIASFIHSQPELAETVVEDLSDLFRASLGDARVPVSLKTELELCHRYLHIEGLRLGDRLRIEWRTDTLPDDALLPALSLQPLLENALYHGIEPCADGGLLEIHGKVDNKLISLSISNSCPTADIPAPHHRGNRMAQANIRERLALFFGPQATLRCEARAAEYRAEFCFPYLQEAP